MRDKVNWLNIPNLLTMARIVGSFFLLFFLLKEDWRLSWIIFLAAALTDMVDGTLARILEQRTRLGAFLDPMADKLLMFFGFFMLTWKGIMPLWITGVVVGRDLMIVCAIFYFIGRKISFAYRPIYLSKVATLLQIVTLCCYLADLYRQAPLMSGDYSLGQGRLFYLTLVTTVVTGMTAVQYVRIGLRICNSNSR